MSQPTPGEQALARRLGLEAPALARARVALNTIAFLPWPEPERLNLLVRLAQAARADVGPILGSLALRAAPLTGMDQLIPIRGIGDFRTAGLTRALADVDLAALGSQAGTIAEIWARTAAVRAENASLRAELDRLYARASDAEEALGSARVLRLDEVATSIASQTAAAAEELRARTRGLHLAGLEIRLECAATELDDAVALDLGAPGRGSALHLRFDTQGSAPGAGVDAEVPDVLGYATALARRKLADRGFATVVSALAGAEGVVSSQTPAPGELVPRGSLVRLLVR